jgi:NAD(P)-dependent dehydrogenase (short-subunit alcohol dehydrogenase family)
MTEPQGTARTVLVTGSTDGIGLETARELARRGWHVVVHGRRPERVDAAIAAVRAAAPAATVEGVTFDLASLASVRAGADALRARLPRLSALVNNAGVFEHERRLSVDGLELTMAVNHFAPFLLTELLAPLLEAGAPARVVNVSSIAHQRGRIDLADLQLARGFNGYGAYAASKLANVLHANALARRHDPARLTANSLHPGVITTKLLQSGFGATGDSLEAGARTSVKLASDPALAGVTGRYFSDGREARAAAVAADVALQDGLWAASRTLVGLA